MLYAAEKVTAEFAVGEFWNKHAQIDVVGVREDGRTDLGECKWGKPGPLQAVADELYQKATHFPNTRQATICRHLFLREISKRAAVPEGVTVHTLEDLYRLKSLA